MHTRSLAAVGSALDRPMARAYRPARIGSAPVVATPAGEEASMRRRYWRLGTLLTWGVGALLLAACGGAAAPAAAPPAQPAAPSQPAAPTASAAAPPAEPVKLTVPYTPVGGPMAPLWIGVEEHLFEKQGLDVTAQFVSGSSPISQ